MVKALSQDRLNVPCIFECYTTAGMPETLGPRGTCVGTSSRLRFTWKVWLTVPSAG